ncbi:helix-turn-helix domain-containing protein [Altererythrobacter xixiisoli]|uniref:Helix-turn-helix domain-containing protein n=1 Tax=Croceibacterium xixiisoli TaxID=1476466 RepID=A0A6I4TQE6_9SPHN|nr:AraC family transcriptional regulator [Croceibacterium xixiisoli]MXO97559.1 helix-turn-helix domain-containing protein [Croceibacterium xixiisoli]
MSLLEEMNTAPLAAADRLPYWNDVASRMITPLHVEPLGAGPFNARIYRRALRECEILSPVSSPARVYRDGEHEAGVLNLQLQHRGRTTNHTGGRTAVLEEGDFVLYDPAKPLWLHFEEPTQAIVLRLPLATVEERMPHLRSQIGIPVKGRGGPGALFSQFLRNAWAELQEGGEGEWAECLGEAIWPLLDMAYADTRPRTETSRRDERRRVLFEAVEADLTDPDLDVHRLARRMGVSARYVQMLFAEMGTTPRAFIQDRRLELAARRLGREGMEVTVTEVAYDAGFNDLSSFCRAFRRRFDTSPRNYRSGQRA